jgi:anti-sigma B factor antagonist
MMQAGSEGCASGRCREEGLLIQNVRQSDEVTIVDVGGRFDAASAPAVRDRLHQLIEEGHSRLLLNLSEMEFIDSAGLGALVSCLRRAAADGGDLRLAEVPAFCRSIFELTRLTRVFNVGESEAQAVAAIQKGAKPSA